MSDPVILSVADYLALVNTALASVPRDLIVEGEISDYKIAHQKWISFDLKDEGGQAVLKCFMTMWQLQTQLEDGMRVRVTGKPGVSPRFGKFQLNVDDVQPVGEGALKRAYELLKKKLLEEGVFDAGRKRDLPRFPKRIGLITSRDAAAYGDFLRILNNRWGGMEIDFVHVHVQGREAVQEILGAFAYFNRLPEGPLERPGTSGRVGDRPEVLILVRGGGGLEDLHAFNDERVVRAVFQSRIPVIVGVGHERDESLCDYAADMRASTPSNAAERLTPHRDQVLYEVEVMARHIETRFVERVADRKRRLETAAGAMALTIERRGMDLQRIVRHLHEQVDVWLPPLCAKLDATMRLLASLDPARVLQRGYAIVRAAGRVVTDASVLDADMGIRVQLANGSVDAKIVGGKRKPGQQALI